MPETFHVSLDTPAPGKIENITRFSGWFLDRNGRCADSIMILVNDMNMFSATRMVRMDVAAAFPGFPLAGSSGFFGDIVIPAELLKSIFNVKLEFVVDGLSYIHDAGEYLCDEISVLPGIIDDKSFHYDDILQSPKDCVQYELAGSKVYHERGSAPLIRLLEGNVTHRYSDEMLRIVHNHSNGVVVDLGCGIRPNDSRFPNVVLLDAVQFPHVEIVSLCKQLPFKDSVIDAIISNAVYEHIPDPFGMAAEIFRILKPGGMVHICTAFMQPFHGDPDHYFNMTLPGLKTVFRDFEIIDEGVEIFQKPSFGFQMQMDALRPFLSVSSWNTLFADFNVNLIKNRTLLDYANELATRTAAAGVFITARKPR